MSQQKLQRLLRRGRVPPVYWSKRLDRDVPASIRQDVREYVLTFPHGAKKNGIGLFFYGPPQSGKLTAAVVLMRLLIVRHSVNVLLLDAEHLRNALYGREAFEAETTTKDHAHAVDVLTIAHLGDERQHADFAPLFASLLRHRRSYRKPTIITTGLAPADVAQRYGQAVNSAVKAALYPLYCGTD